MILKVVGNLGFVNDHIKVERIINKIFRLEILLLIHLLAEVFSPGFISRDHVDHELSTLVVLPDDGQIGRVVKHVGESFGGEKSPADHNWLRWVPEGVIFLLEFRDHSCLKVSF